MAISMHSASVPIFARMLGNLMTWLDKAEAHAAARKFDTTVYLGARGSSSGSSWNEISMASSTTSGRRIRVWEHPSPTIPPRHR